MGWIAWLLVAVGAACAACGVYSAQDHLIEFGTHRGPPFGWSLMWFGIGLAGGVMVGGLLALE